jgi:hypothetical protein
MDLTGIVLTRLLKLVEPCVPAKCELINFTIETSVFLCALCGSKLLAPKCIVPN